MPARRRENSKLAAGGKVLGFKHHREIAGGDQE